jgi:hypothetical protein
MSTKLNQILSIERRVKNDNETVFTKSYELLQKKDLITGLSKTYSPKEEEGEQFPQEQKRVQVRVTDEIRQVSTALTELLDITAQKDATNTVAKADVTIDGKILMKDVPATHLLFLEKKLVDIKTFISRLPVLDQGVDWKWDETQSLYASQPQETIKTRKVTKHIVVVPPTEQHPAQVKEANEDIIQGTWKTTHYASALPHDEVKKLADKADRLYRAVKYAREEANGHEVLGLKTGKAVVDYIFGS